MANEEITVGIGEMAVAHNPTVISALGLGSCVGVALYDREAHVGGLAHVMLPDSREFAGRLETEKSLAKLLKYADVAIPAMLDDMAKLGAKKERVCAKIAGGAQMFPEVQAECMQIGQRNVNAVIKVLKERGIPLDAQDTGGNIGRTIRFDIQSQKIRIKTMKGEKEI